MKKLLAALILALILSVVAGSGAALATHSNGEGPNNDFARGTVKEFVSIGSVEVEQINEVNATSGAAGEDPRGHFFIKSHASVSTSAFNFEASGRVTCLRVGGNRAMVGGVVERGTTVAGTSLEGRGYLVTIVDNGEPNAVDGFLGFFTFTPPQTCPPPSLAAPPSNLGNYIVHDATMP